VKWEAAALSDTGQRRRNNEDAVLVRADLGLFLVADGMGGHVAGEVASQIATETVAREIATFAAALEDPAAAARVLTGAVRSANASVLEEAERDPRRSGMGTTLTAALLLPASGHMQIAHVGDSRAYLSRRGSLSQLTRDHTWVQQQVDLGLLSPAQARSHEASSVLTQAIGTDPRIVVDEILVSLETGDVVLLCSDGLTAVLEDQDIAAELARATSIHGLAQTLVARANAGGGPDNISVVLFRIS
jgi:serine/threonine protein phosphatase PrpC